MVQTMAGSAQNLILCPHCDQAVWLDALLPHDGLTHQEGLIKMLARRICGSRPKEAPVGMYIRTVSLPFRVMSKRDYLGFADGGELSREQETYARICGWWCSNLPHREARPEAAADRAGRGPEWSAEDRRNLDRLERLLRGEQGVEERLRRAELLRELGRFEEVPAVLAGLPVPEWLAELSRQILRLSEAGDAWVAPTDGSWMGDRRG